MNRRDAVLSVLALAAAPRDLFAQQQGKVWRIGILSQSGASATVGFGAFLRGMRELGYVEGKNLTVDWRYAENKLERLPARTDEVIQ